MVRAVALAALLLADVTPRADYFRPESAKHIATIQVGRVPIVSIAYTRDARRLVVLASDGQLSIWNVGTRSLVRQVAGKTFSNHMSVSDDLTRAVGPSTDRRSFRLIDLERGEELHSFTDAHASHPQTCALSPDGKRVALVKRDLSVRLLDATTGEEVKTLLSPPSGQGGSLAWSPDGRSLAVHGWDSTVRLIDVASGEVRGTITGVSQTPQFLGYSPNSSTFVHITHDSRIRLYDKAGKALPGFDERVAGARMVAFSRDGRLMAVAAYGGKARIWDTRTWKPLRDLEVGTVSDLAFSPDGRHLACGAPDGTVKLWGAGRGITAAAGEAPRGGPGFLGIAEDPEAAEGEAGVVIGTVIAGTAAEKAGLKVGDVILKIGTTATDDFETLRGAVTALREGDEIEVTYRREKAETKVKIKLGGRPTEPPQD